MKINPLISVLLLCVLTACSQTPALPGQKLGKPYVVDGRTYYPDYDEKYDETGDASWYGPGFHGKYTANGEVFNQNDITAAHPTLPMPCLVKVTNLSNGKSLVVRINDRGPFKSNRIIDLSKGSAERLGIKSITRVRVQYLKEETIAYLNGGNPATGEMAASNIPDHVDVTPAADGAPAPITTVSSSDLLAPAGNPGQHVAGKNSTYGKPVELVHEAWADDNVTLPDPKKPAVVPVDDASTVTAAPVAAPVAPAPKAAKGKTAKVAAAPKVEPKIVPKEEASEPKVAAASGTYIIQAGVFSSEANVKKLEAKLSGIAGVKTEQIELNGKQLWRVRIGGFADKAAAQVTLDKVRAAGVPDAHIMTPNAK